MALVAGCERRRVKSGGMAVAVPVTTGAVLVRLAGQSRASVPPGASRNARTSTRRTVFLHRGKVRGRSRALGCPRGAPHRHHRGRGHVIRPQPDARLDPVTTEDRDGTRPLVHACARSRRLADGPTTTEEPQKTRRDFATPHTVIGRPPATTDRGSTRRSVLLRVSITPQRRRHGFATAQGYGRSS